MALRRRRTGVRRGRSRARAAVRRQPDLPGADGAARRVGPMGAARQPADDLVLHPDPALSAPIAVAHARPPHGRHPRHPPRRGRRVRRQSRGHAAGLLRGDPVASDGPARAHGVHAGGDVPPLPWPPQTDDRPQDRGQARRDDHGGAAARAARWRRVYVVRRDHGVLRRLDAAHPLPHAALQVRRSAGLHQPAGERRLPRARRPAAAIRVRVAAGHDRRGVGHRSHRHPVCATPCSPIRGR